MLWKSKQTLHYLNLENLIGKLNPTVFASSKEGFRRAQIFAMYQDVLPKHKYVILVRVAYSVETVPRMCKLLCIDLFKMSLFLFCFLTFCALWSGKLKLVISKGKTLCRTQKACHKIETCKFCLLQDPNT